MNRLYLAWQEPSTRKWLPVGMLSFDGKLYRFSYTRGASESSIFEPFPKMKRLEEVYESEELFPLFSNRLLTKTRPEYNDFLSWLKMDKSEQNQLKMLALTGAARATDSLEMFACPSPTADGNYEISFFSHGISHLDKYVIEKVNGLDPGGRLFIMHDLQNSYDFKALALRTSDPMTIVGYCPRYLDDDVHKLISLCDPQTITMKVEQVNRQAPLQLRLLCRLVAPWPAGFEPCSSPLYQPIVASGK
ncbi:MAG: hypothetical protein P4L43_17250 [Syntrophobacteraceae bacterium]|nr:hypothetical protein [Syntrophobacteraceae bacterium]